MLARKTIAPRPLPIPKTVFLPGLPGLDEVAAAGLQRAARKAGLTPQGMVARLLEGVFRQPDPLPRRPDTEITADHRPRAFR
jgi:hypothetical protein